MNFFKNEQQKNDRRKPLDWLSSVNPLNRIDRYLIAKFLGTYFFSIILIIMKI